MHRLLASNIRQARQWSRLPTPFLSRGVAQWAFKTYGEPDGPNYHLIQFLVSEYQKQVAKNNEDSDILHAIKSLNEIDYAIERHHALTGISGVNKRIALLILNFLGTGRKYDMQTALAVDDVEPHELVKRTIIKELQSVNGIGPLKAAILYKKGCKSLTQITDKRYLPLLPDYIQRQLLSEKNIVSEVSKAQAEHFKNELLKIIPSEFEVHLVGNFRRGGKTASRIDILLFHPSYNEPPITTNTVNIYGFVLPPKTKSAAPEGLLHKSAITPMQDKGLINTTVGGNPDIWHGVIPLPSDDQGLLCKATIALMPMCSRATALIAYTGDTAFYHMCRTKARQKRYLLNEFGLWHEQSSEQIKQFTSYQGLTDEEGFPQSEESGLKALTSVPLDMHPVSTEEELLSILGITARLNDPESRNVLLEETQETPELPIWDVAQYPYINLTGKPVGDHQNTAQKITHTLKRSNARRFYASTRH
ncbi:hypothetical protein M422DRAFT_24819 [Sphaerobolus stellatus SS14]|nr:hypothetical protein M422DRAFT_24819 [Sphaerobolus stellatus SS14]